MTPFSFDLFLRPHLVPRPTVDTYLAAAREADGLGFRSILYGDHLGIGRATHRYPYGEFAHGPDTPWPEPLVLLAAVAATTNRLRLSTGVLLAPLRSTLLFAKMAATLDWLSDGRVELGLGVGWQHEEYAASGIAWSERHDRLEQTLVQSRRIWTGDLVELPTGDGESVQLRCQPTPVQRRLPLILGVNTRSRNLRLLVEHADGWCPVGVTADDVRTGLAMIAEERANRGLHDRGFLVRISLVPERTSTGALDGVALVEKAAEWLAAGVTNISVAPSDAFGDRSELSDFLREVAELATTVNQP